MAHCPSKFRGKTVHKAKGGRCYIKTRKGARMVAKVG